MKDKYEDPEVDRFARYWKKMEELERQQQQKDCQDKKNGKLAIQRPGYDNQKKGGMM